jgi:hypothetical protein
LGYVIRATKPEPIGIRDDNGETINLNVPTDEEMAENLGLPKVIKENDEPKQE